jgi:Ca-activated chloride channel family protein
MGLDPSSAQCLTKLGCAGVSDSGEFKPVERSNGLLMLDSSGSMRGKAEGGKRKIDVAKAALRRYVGEAPEETELRFLVYGHKGSSENADKARSCAGSEILADIGEVDPAGFPETLASFRPRGFTPIAGALEEAKAAFTGKEGDANRIVLVSDGVETCGGDPVRVARELKREGISVTVDIVGFDIENNADADRLREIAEVSGGEYTDARTADELDRFFVDYSKRQSELIDAQLCVLKRKNDVYGCQLGEANDAYSVMSDMASDEPDPARKKAIRNRRDEIRDRASDYRDENRERFDRLDEKLEGRTEEARERIGK